LIAAHDSSNGGLDLTLERSLKSWTAHAAGGRDAAEVLTRLGDAQTGVALLGAAYWIARWTDHERGSRVASLSGEALLNAGLHTELLKRLARRTRPSFGGDGTFFVDHPDSRQEPTSFPSGHAAGAFAVATVIASEYRDHRWVPWVTYGAAGLIAASRVALGRHFPSDVLAGAALGNSMGRMVVQRSGGADADAEPEQRIEPWFDPQSGALGIQYRRSW
jgi:membrane-associated phospholipid phosphatase